MTLAGNLRPWPGWCFTFYAPTTSDWPGMFVCRPFDYMRGDGEPHAHPLCCVLADEAEVEQQREHLSVNGLVRLSAAPDDDPDIVETWI